METRLDYQGPRLSGEVVHTYGEERRRHAVRIIEVSGTYLRFISESGIDVSKLQGIGTEKREDQEADDGLVFDKQLQAVDPDKAFLKAFFAKNTPFLLGIDVPYGHSELNPPRTARASTAPYPSATRCTRPIPQLPELVRQKFGRDQFTLVGITMQLPGDIDEALAADGDLEYLRKNVRWISDDHLPGSDAHSVYGVNHALGAVVVVRPDLWAGITVVPDEGVALDEYFSGFLLAQ
ncbi:phenol monooxygenase [Salix suchowensis]|nr:phenol monooxygenase [Salix suchowensis]